MAVYKLQGPDGKVYTIEGPEGATAEQLGAVITGQSDGRAARAAAAQEAARKEFDPTNGMSTTDKVLSGVGKAFTDLGRGAGQLVGAVSRDDVAESRKTDAALMNTGAGQVGNLLGNVAAFAPTAMIPGANTATGGALIGAASGLLSPSTSTAETAKNVGIGTVAGGAVPTLITALKTGKSLIEPLYQGGRDKIVGRAITDASATDPAALAQALRGSQSAVPGVQRTVAEVADNPSLAALQRTASQINPAVMNDAAARAATNNEARLLTLKGAVPDRQSAVAARDAATSKLYSTADALPVDASQLTDLLKRPSMQSAVQRAQQLAAEAGENFDAQNLTGRGAHYVKKAMDDIASGGPVAGMGANEQRAVRNTLTDYLGRLEQQLPSYGQARNTYAQMSRPVNQSDVLEEVAKNATNFRGDLTPAAFARAMSDKTAERVTGQSGATMGKVLEPGQLSAMNAIKDDLLRSDFAATAGKGVGSDTVQKLAYSNMLGQAGVPSFVRNLGPAGIVGNVAQRAGQIVYKDANEKLGEQLARALLNPNEAGDLVTGAMVSPQLQALANALKRGGTALGASAPALVQANQQ